MGSPKEDRLEQINTQTNKRITTANSSLKLYHIICDRAWSSFYTILCRVVNFQIRTVGEKWIPTRDKEGKFEQGLVVHTPTTLAKKKFRWTDPYVIFFFQIYHFLFLIFNYLNNFVIIGHGGIQDAYFIKKRVCAWVCHKSLCDMVVTHAHCIGEWEIVEWTLVKAAPKPFTP